MSWAFRNAEKEEAALTDKEAAATCKYGIDHMIKPLLNRILPKYQEVNDTANLVEFFDEHPDLNYDIFFT